MSRFRKIAAFLRAVQWLVVELLLLACLVIIGIKILKYEWRGVPDRNFSVSTCIKPNGGPIALQ